MKKYDNVYISGIRACYERFVINNEPPSDDWNIDPDILESWKRSKAYGIDIDSPIKYDLTEEELRDCLEENQLLVETALPYIQHISRVLEGTHFVIVLTDENGHVLETFADKHPFDRKVMEKYNMRRGAIRRECFVGTDSIALAIELRKPVEVYGEEHFLIENHTLVCTSAPIFISDEMIGTLTIMGPREMYQRYTMGMVCAIVDGIEKEIKLKNINDSLYSANDILRTAIENIESGIFVLDANYDIQQYNQKAVRILNVNDHERLRDMNFFSIIERMSIPERIRDMKKMVHDVPVTLTTQKGMRVDVSLSISLIRSAEGALKSIIVGFKRTGKELKENRYSMANTMRSVISEYDIDIPEEREKDSYEEKDRQRIKDILIKEKGDVRKVAEHLEMSLSTVYRKLKKYNIRARDFKL